MPNKTSNRMRSCQELANGQPGTSTVQRGNILEEGHQIRQQAAVKRLTVLEGDNHPPRLLLLLIEEDM
jgi:hypothetical protein